MRKNLLISLVLCLIALSGILYVYRSPTSILIIVPNDYRGKLIIKQNVLEGGLPESSALENYGDYVYEFAEVHNETVFVRDISPVINATEVFASEMNVTPVKLKVLSSNKEEDHMTVEILK